MPKNTASAHLWTIIASTVPFLVLQIGKSIYKLVYRMQSGYGEKLNASARTHTYTHARARARTHKRLCCAAHALSQISLTDSHKLLEAQIIFISSAGLNNNYNCLKSSRRSEHGWREFEIYCYICSYSVNNFFPSLVSKDNLIRLIAASLCSSQVHICWMAETTCSV